MPQADPEANPMSGDKITPLTPESVAANLRELLESLNAEPSDCRRYMSVLDGIEGYTSTPFAALASARLPLADDMHRRATGPDFHHHPECSMAGPQNP